MGDIREWLREHPKYIPMLEEIIEWEENNPRPKSKVLEKYDGKDTMWQSKDVGIHGSSIYQMEMAGIVDRVYDSNSKTDYALNNREKIKSIVNDLKIDDKQGLRTVEHSFPSEEELPDGLFDDVIGYDDVKWLMTRALTTDKITNFLLVGPPGSAKTVFLMCISRLDDAEFIPATEATSAGFTELLLDNEPKYMLFDELDDMPTDEQKSLSSYTETGIVRQTKHNKNRKLRINTKTIASANSTDTILDHIVNRFTVLNFEPYSKEEFIEVCTHILPKDEGVTEHEADTIARGIWAKYGAGDVRQAIQVARLSDGDPKRVLDVLDEYSASGIQNVI